MQAVLPYGTRQFTDVTFANLKRNRQPYNWELAHAVLNASETGLMTIDEIVNVTVLAVPARFMEDPDRKMKSCRSAMANNMSISPDFYKAVRLQGESCYRWALTGSVQGVPRPDKRAKRREPTPANSRAAASSPMGKRAKGKGKKVRSLRGIHHQEEDDTLYPVPEESAYEVHGYSVPEESAYEVHDYSVPEESAYEVHDYSVPEENAHEVHEEVMMEATPNSDSDEDSTFDPAEDFEEGDDIFETALLDGQPGFINIAQAFSTFPREIQDSLHRKADALLAELEAIGMVRSRA